MGLFRGQLGLGCGHVRLADPLELLGEVGLGLLELVLELRSAPQAAIDLDVGQLLLALVAVGRAAPPAGEHDQACPDQGDPDPNAHQHGQAGHKDARDRQPNPGQDRDQPDQGRQAPGGLRGRRLEIDLDLARQEALQLVDPGIDGDQPPNGLAEDRQGLLGGMAGGQAARSRAVAMASV